MIGTDKLAHWESKYIYTVYTVQCGVKEREGNSGRVVSLLNEAGDGVDFLVVILRKFRKELEVGIKVVFLLTMRNVRGTVGEIRTGIGGICCYSVKILV